MYESYYGLRCDPFRMRPNQQFALRHEMYGRARGSLEYGLLRGEGIVLVTGATGTGKSILVEDLLSEYTHLNIRVARMMATPSDVGDVLRLAAFAMGIAHDNTDKISSFIAIQNHVQDMSAKGVRILLIIDEAQNLSAESLEELRLFSNIQGKDGGGFQLFLLGQPALRELILGASMEQFRQRIIAFCNLEPMSEQTTREYIQHRLLVAGWKGDPKITADAVAQIHRFGRGIPRRINLICSRLLLQGFAEEKHLLDANDVRDVMAELAPEMVESAILEELAAEASHEKSALRVADIGGSKSAVSLKNSRRNIESRNAAHDVEASYIFQAVAVESPVIHPAGRKTSSVPDRKAEPPAREVGAMLEPEAIVDEELIMPSRSLAVPLPLPLGDSEIPWHRHMRDTDRPMERKPAVSTLRLAALLGLCLAAWLSGLVGRVGTVTMDGLRTVGLIDASGTSEAVAESRGVRVAKSGEDARTDAGGPWMSTAQDASAVESMESNPPGAGKRAHDASAEWARRKPSADMGVREVNGKWVIAPSLAHSLQRYATQIESLESGELRVVPRGMGANNDRNDRNSLREAMSGIGFVLRNHDGIRVEVRTASTKGDERSSGANGVAQSAELIVAELLLSGLSKDDISRRHVARPAAVGEGFDLELRIVPATP